MEPRPRFNRGKTLRTTPLVLRVPRVLWVRLQFQSAWVWRRIGIREAAIPQELAFVQPTITKHMTSFFASIPRFSTKYLYSQIIRQCAAIHRTLRLGAICKYHLNEVTLKRRVTLGGAVKMG